MKEVKKIVANSKNKKIHSTKDSNSIYSKIETKKTVEQKELEYEIRKDIKNDHHSSKKLVILVISLIILIILFTTIHFINPKIELNGINEVEIPYGGIYIEEGATAKYFNTDLTNKLKITNNIDTNKVGIYEVVYTVDYSFYKIQKKRIVKVVDKIKPIIILDGGNEVNVCPNGSYKEIGFTASDEYDGDLTDKVKVKKEKNKVIYNVKDSAGNSYSVIRKISEVDIEKPTITLKGNTTMYLTLEDDFIEPGYIATDNCSDNLTDKVVVTGEVKAKKKGTYILTYEVIDAENNKTIVKRKVIVSEKTDPNTGVIKKGTIYLTFDDGPRNVLTGDILDILKEEGVKATFFVTNNGPDYLIKRIYDEGHTIALHTASHNYSKIYSSSDSYFDDLEIVSDRVKRITGYTSKIVRFPGGSSNTISSKYNQGIMTKLSEELFNQGYRYYDWNIDSGDASSAKNEEDIYNNVVSNLSKNRMNVVLMHDTKKTTRDTLRNIISYGKENGYTFDRIDMDTYMIRQNIKN